MIIHPVLLFFIVVYVLIGLWWYFFRRPKQAGGNLNFSFISSFIRKIREKLSFGRSKPKPAETQAFRGTAQYPHSFTQPGMKAPGPVSSAEFTFSSEQALNRKPTLELKGTSLRPRVMNYEESNIPQTESQFYGPLGFNRPASDAGLKSLDFGTQSSRPTGSVTFKQAEPNLGAGSTLPETFNPFYHPIVGESRFITSKNALPLTGFKQSPYDPSASSLIKAPSLANPNSEDYLPPIDRTSSVNYPVLDSAQKQAQPAARDFGGFNTHSGTAMQQEENIHTGPAKDSLSKKLLQSSASAFKKHEGSSLKPTRKEEKDLKFQQKQDEANEKATKVIETLKSERIVDEGDGIYQSSRSRFARKPVFSDQSEDEEDRIGQKNQRGVSLPARQPSKKIKMSNEVAIPADSGDKKPSRRRFGDDIDLDDEESEEDTTQQKPKFRIGEYKGTYKRRHHFLAEEGKNYGGPAQNGKSSKRFVSDTDLVRPMRISNPASDLEHKIQTKPLEESKPFDSGSQTSKPFFAKADDQKDRLNISTPQEKSGGLFSHISSSKPQESAQKPSSLLGETSEKKIVPDVKPVEQKKSDVELKQPETKTVTPLFGGALSGAGTSLLNKPSGLDSGKSLISLSNTTSQQESSKAKETSSLLPTATASMTADAKKENGPSTSSGGLFSNLSSVTPSTNNPLFSNSLSSNPTQTSNPPADQAKEKPAATPSLFGGITKSGGLLSQDANASSTKTESKPSLGGAGLFSTLPQSQPSGTLAGSTDQNKGLFLNTLIAASTSKEKLAFSGGLFNNEQKSSSGSLLSGNLGSGSGSSLFSNLNNQQNGSYAPYLFLLLQVVLIAIACVTCTTFVSFGSRPLPYIFWIATALTLIIYEYVHLKDPGYVPHDGIFYTDQEEESCRSNAKLKNNNNHSFNALFDKRKDQLNEVERINFMNGEIAPNEQMLQMASSSRRDRLNEPQNSLGNRRNEHVPQSELEDSLADGDIQLNFQQDDEGDEKEDVFADEPPKNQTDKQNLEQQQKTLLQTPKFEFKDERNPLQSSNQEEIEEEGKRSKTMPFAGAPGHKKFLSTLGHSTQNNGESLGLSSPSYVRRMEFTEDPGKSRSTKQQHFYTDQENIPQNIQPNIGKKMLTDTNFHGKKKLHLSGKWKTSLKGDSSVTTSTVSNARNPTGEENSTKTKGANNAVVIIDQKSYTQLNEEDAAMSSQDRFGRPKTLIDGYVQQKMLETIDVEAPKTESLAGTYHSPKGNKKGSLFSQNKGEIELSVQKKEGMESNDPNASSHVIQKKNSISEDKEEGIYIERRYCTVCSIDQPIRSKHCKKCDRCIARYDHHCPWLGTCIGEWNHVWFFWFLFAEFSQLVSALVQIILTYTSQETTDLIVMKVIRGLLCAVVVFFTLMTSSLLVFHAYLACKNLTTWERLSWNRISYLQEWPKSRGSPFTQGFRKNLSYFCCGSRKILQRWRFPHQRKYHNNSTRKN